MSVQIHVPMAGLLRVLFFIAIASALIAFVLAAVTGIYEGPGEDVARRVSSTFVNEAEGKYNRNLGLIYSLVAGGIMATAILALRSQLNALRCGLLGAGLVVFYAAAGYASSGANDWLLAVWSLLILVVLGGSARYLDDGAPFAVSELPGLPRG